MNAYFWKMVIPQAKALRPGDVLGIIAPASPPRSEERIEKSVRYFEQLGYRVELGKHLRDALGTRETMDRSSYLAAPDKDRLADLHTMFRSKRVRAIFYHRGGYGSIRLLDNIDYGLIRGNPKIIVGYSDATALFAALYKKSKLASCFFGPMPGVDLWNEIDPFTEEHFWRAMTSTKPLGNLPQVSPTKPTWNGEHTPVAHPNAKKNYVEGRILGGNLTVFCSLLGTPYQPSFKSAIPFFEEIDEKPRKIDAYLAQLRLAGLFNDAKAIVLGQFTNCDRDKDAPTLSLREIFDEYFAPLKKPVLSGVPFGHEKQMWTLPYGARLRIVQDGEQRTLSVMESVLR